MTFIPTPSTPTIPKWKIEEIRKMYSEGRKRGDIAVVLDISEATARRYSEDLEFPRNQPLSAEKRHELMVGWR